jgi:hypothetical protein
MHTDDSTLTEIAASKVAAARNILAGVLLELEEGSLLDADEAVDKAGGKLLAASAAIAEAKRQAAAVDTPFNRRRAARWSYTRLGGGS